MPLVRELPRFSQPGHCIMFPGRRRDERGFFLFDTVIQGAHGDIQVGISGEGLRTIAQRYGAQFGLALREELRLADERTREAEAALAEANARIEELEQFKERVAGLAADGFRVQRKLGRPTKKEDE